MGTVLLFFSIEGMIILITLGVFIMLIRKVINAFKRSSINKFFKNNVVETFFEQNKQYVKTINAYSSNKQNHKNDIQLFQDKYVDVNAKVLEEFKINDIKSLKKYLFEIFTKFEKAYNELDFNTMKSLSTSQLYQNYYTGIKLDMQDGNKKMIDEIKLKDIIVFEALSSSIKQIISCKIDINYKNYTLNSIGQVIRGSQMHSVDESFEVTFRKDFDKNDVIKCPNCGASINGSKCDYCRTLIRNEEFKISSIKKIVETKK